MAARCDLTDKGLQVGHKVSHSQVKTKRAFKVNLQKVTLHSKYIGKFSLRIAVSTLRSIEHKGGIDDFLLNTSSTKLTPEGIRLKKKVLAAQEGSKTNEKQTANKEAA